MLFRSLKATIQSQNSTNVRAELILPTGANFFTENAVKTANTGTDVVSWIVKAPATTVQNAKIYVVTRAVDENSNKPIESDRDSILVTVQKKAMLELTAGTPKSILSVGEEFEISAVVNNSGEAALLDEAELRINLPAGFTTSADTIKETAQLTTSWIVKAPSVPSSVPQNIRISIQRTPLDQNTNNFATVNISISTVVVRVEAKQMEFLKLTSFTQTAMAEGEKNVPLLGFQLKNRGSRGSNPIHLRGIMVYIYDNDGKLISPQSMFAGLTVRNFTDTTIVYGHVTNLPAENPVSIPFTNILILTAGAPYSLIGIYGDVLPAAAKDIFFVTVENNSDVDAVDGVTKQSVTLVDERGISITNLDISSTKAVILAADFNTTFRNFPNPFGKQDRPTTSFVYFLVNDSDGELRLFTLTGDLVWLYKFSSSDPAGQRGIHSADIVWDGKNGNGFSCACPAVTVG